jgi:hypothetical protein
VSTTERLLGAMPSSRPIERRRLVSVLLPTPVRATEAESVRHVRVDGEAFLAEVAAQLDRKSIEAGSVEALIDEGPAGIEPEGWLLVICRDDESAVYGLPPSPATTRVTNVDAFCPRAEASLADADLDAGGGTPAAPSRHETRPPP